ncbi:hypothetical protein [Candidatus Hodgkinia cicadicola]
MNVAIVLKVDNTVMVNLEDICWFKKIKVIPVTLKGVMLLFVS